LEHLPACQNCAGSAKTAKGWRIGAVDTWRTIIRAACPPPLTAETGARDVGSIQIQNAAPLRAPVNLRPPPERRAAPLTLEATVELRSATTRVFAFVAFLQAWRQTERAQKSLCSAVQYPDPAPSTATSSFRQARARKYW